MSKEELLDSVKGTATSSVSHILQDLGLHELKGRLGDLRLVLLFRVV